MGAPREWFDGFDLGEFLGLGLDNAQIGHLAGALFLALFGLSALRRVTRAAGPMPAVWIAVAVGLLSGAILVASRGFADQVPEDLRTWTTTDRLLHAAAVLGLLGCAAICLAAHWVRRSATRVAFRLLGMFLVSVAVWLAAEWFGDELPQEARPWAAGPIVTRGLTVLGLIGAGIIFWIRPAGELPHRRWTGRTLAVPVIGIAGVLAVRWFGASVAPELPVADVVRVTAVVALIATGTCALVAVGAYWLRPRPDNKTVRPATAENAAAPLPLAPGRRLPVAVLLDDQGRPILPVDASGSGSAGA
jgi:hypothetical protein